MPFKVCFTLVDNRFKVRYYIYLNIVSFGDSGVLIQYIFIYLILKVTNNIIKLISFYVEYYVHKQLY